MSVIAYNAQAMEQIRAETEATMNAQASAMEITAALFQSMASTLDSEAAALDAEAAAQDVIAATAMKTITVRGPDGPETIEVPDTAARAAAAAKAANLRAQSAAKRAQSAALRTQATAITSEVGRLRQALVLSNAFMRNLIEIAQRTDLSFAQMQAMIEEETAGFTAFIASIKNGIFDALTLTGATLAGLLGGAHGALEGFKANIDAHIANSMNRLGGMSFAELSDFITQVVGSDMQAQLLLRTMQAEGMLRDWGFPPDSQDASLLLQKFNDHVMMTRIENVNQRPEFSFANWENATLAERQTLLQNYMNALTSIKGVDINQSINFFSTPPNAQGLITFGTYNHSQALVSVNSWVLENHNTETAHERMLETIRHELRHAFQASTIENPDNFHVSNSTVDAWQSNYPGLGGTYIQPGAERSDGNGHYTWQDYANQPIETDAFAFGGMREWVKAR